MTKNWRNQDEKDAFLAQNGSFNSLHCQEKNDKIVEYAFRDFNKAMGVSTFVTGNELPAPYKEHFPDIEVFKKLIAPQE